MAWLDGWGNNIFRFTIDHTKIDSNLSNFPLLVTLSGSCGTNNYDASHIFDELGSNKKKIAITTADGSTQCPVEIEYWNATEEVAHLWTKVPTVYSTVDTTMYLYYDSTQGDNIDYVSEATDVRAQLILNLGAEGTYDTTGVSGPCVIKEGETYKMWYAGIAGSGWRILYCESTDGFTWSNHQMVVNINSLGTYDTTHVHFPCVIKDGDAYKMWYTGYGTYWSIIYCTSTNGTTWSGFQHVVDIGSEGTYDTSQTQAPNVMKDGSTYKMWYGGYDGTNYRAIYCTSTNGTSWSNHQLAVNIASEGTYDDNHVYHPCVIKEDSIYKMWYIGNDHTYYRLIYCTSTNGTTWSNFQMIMDYGFEGTYDSNRPNLPCVILDDNVYRIWYAGYDGSNWRVLYTRSHDGIRPGRASSGVWDSDFVGVWHMNQDPSGGSGAIKDSTYSENHGTPQGSMASNDLVGGIIGKAIEFDGTDDFISCGNDSNLNIAGNLTYEAIANWIDIARATNFDVLVGVYEDATHAHSLGSTWQGDELRWLSRGGSGVNGVQELQENIWYYTAASLESSDVRLYVNDNLDNTGLGVTVTRPTTGTCYMATEQDSVYYYNGLLGEVRVSKTNRTGAWTKATYYSAFDNLLSFDPLSYLEGQCTDRYGVPMDEICYVTVLDETNHSVLGYGTTVSGTGRFSIRVYGKEAGSTVLVTYGYPGDYMSSSYPAGAEYMSTISGTTLSGGGY